MTVQHTAAVVFAMVIAPSLVVIIFACIRLACISFQERRAYRKGGVR